MTEEFCMKRLAFSVAALAVIALAALAASPPDGHAQATTIDVGSDYFCAASFENSVCETTVAAGSTVTWQVTGGVHNVTQCDASFATCPPPGGFDSGLLNGGAYSQTFASPGTISYYCAFHPDQMRGRILVQAQSTATPIPSTPGPAGTPTPGPAATSAQGVSPSPVQVPSGGGATGGSFPLVAVAIAVTLLAIGGVAGAGAFTTARIRVNEAED